MRQCNADIAELVDELAPCIPHKKLHDEDVAEIMPIASSIVSETT
jgi:hypothetical protein